MLNKKQREAAFPIHIELGRKEGSSDMPSPAGSKKGKPRTYYPTVYIDAIPGLEYLPKEGCMLVEFRRKRLSLDETTDGEETMGATLEIRAICLPEKDEGADTLEDAFKKLSKGEVADDDSDYVDDEE